MPETWTWRDLPVLTAVVEQFDPHMNGNYPDVPDIVEATGLSMDDVARALNALDGEYLTLDRHGSGGAPPTEWWVSGISSVARRAVGQWPSPDVLVDRLTTALQQVADQASDENTKSRVRRAVEALGGLTKDVVVEVAAKMAEHQIGLS